MAESKVSPGVLMVNMIISTCCFDLIYKIVLGKKHYLFVLMLRIKAIL